MFDRIKNGLKNIRFQTQKHTPEIAVVTAMIGVPVTVGLAIHATLKVDDILAEKDGQLFKIEEVKTNENVTDDIYSEEDAKRDTAVVYVQTGLKIAKLYTPTFIAGSITMGTIFLSYKVLKKRNIALAASLAGLDQSFKEYRRRVAEKVGDEEERNIRYGLKAEEITKTVNDPETGEEKEVKDISIVHNKNANYGPFAKYFDSSSSYYEDNPEYNLDLLMRVQKRWNRTLAARRNGIVFLNEVLASLDIPVTRAGQIAGWKYDPKGGDNQIDFGIFIINREANRRFVNGYEPVVLLDFNCKSDVYSDLEEVV